MNPKLQDLPRFPGFRNPYHNLLLAHCVSGWIVSKEIVERRHGEPIKFLFLPKMGLLGSQASTEKKIRCEF